MTSCPNCGELAKDKIQIYNGKLRKQSFNILPVLFTCKLCGAEVTTTHQCIGGNIGLSHVILPEDMNRYISIFESRNIKYNFFLLKPDYQTAVERCQS